MNVEHAAAGGRPLLRANHAYTACMGAWVRADTNQHVACFRMCSMHCANGSPHVLHVSALCCCMHKCALAAPASQEGCSRALGSAHATTGADDILLQSLPHSPSGTPGMPDACTGRSRTLPHFCVLPSPAKLWLALVKLRTGDLSGQVAGKLRRPWDPNSSMIFHQMSPAVSVCGPACLRDVPSSILGSSTDGSCGGVPGAPESRPGVSGTLAQYACGGCSSVVERSLRTLYRFV